MPWSKSDLPESVKKLAADWSDAQIDVFVKTANAILKETGNEGEAIATGIKQAKNKNNSKYAPRSFYCKHMETGVAQYSDETILLDGDDIKRMIPTFRDKPVYVNHVDDVNLETLQEDAAGYVTESFYNELDGWLWAKFIIVSDAGHDAIAKGWKVSNSYLPTEWTGAGTHHNVPYNRKITNGIFNHLAIVPDPRYEEAIILTPEQFTIYQEEKRTKLKALHNSKNGVTKMLKFFKNERKEISNVDIDAMVELEDGTAIALKDMISLVSNSMEKEKEEEKAKMNDNDEVEVGGEKMTLKELKNKYSNYKKNADKKNDADDDTDMENKKKNDDSDGEEEKKKEEEEKANKKKANSKHFDELANAPFSNSVSQVSEVIDLPSDMFARGRARYGK